MQKCGRCKQDKDEDQFAPSYRGKPGTWCRSCVSAYARGDSASAAHEPRTCDGCGEEYVPRQLKQNARFCSRTCKGIHRAVSGRQRELHLRRKYGITPEDYDRMLAEQGGGCAICGRGPSERGKYRQYLHVDHCHETGRVRGLLCDQHNLLLGQWGDDVDQLRRAIEYLTKNA